MAKSNIRESVNKRKQINSIWFWESPDGALGDYVIDGNAIGALHEDSEDGRPVEFKRVPFHPTKARKQRG